MSRMAAVAGRRGVVAGLLGAILLAPAIPILQHPATRILGHYCCDGPSFFYPIHDFAARCWRGGEIPLWNPHIMLGIPFLGEGHASIFHPLSAFFLFLPTGAAMNALLLTSFVLTGLAFYGYLRAIDLGRAAAFFGAIVWSFSAAGFSRVYAGHTSIVQGFPAWPFILLCWHRYLRDRRMRDLALLSMGYAWLLLAAHPQSTYYFSLFFLMYALLHGIGRPAGPAASWSRSMAWLGAAVALGIALGAVQLLPTLDFARSSFRSQSSYEFCTFFSLPPEDFITLLCPELFGKVSDPCDGQYWGRILSWEMWLYIGVLPLLAGLTGIFAAPRRRRLALGVPAAIFLVLALGRYTPLYRFCYEHLPLYDVFRSPSRHAIVTTFCIVVFAAQGFQSWLDGLSLPNERSSTHDAVRPYRTAIAAGGLMLAVCIPALVMVMPHADTDGSIWRRFMDWVGRGREINIRPSDSFPTLAARAATHQLWRACLLLLAGVALLVVLRRWSRRSSHTSPSRATLAVGALSLVLLVDFGTFFPQFLACYDESQTRYENTFLAALPHTPYPARYYDALNEGNRAMLHDLSTVGGYSGTTLRRFNRFITQTQGLDPSLSQASVRLRQIPPIYLRLLAIDALHVSKSAASGELPATPTDEESVMLDCRGHCPRAFIAPSPKTCAAPDDALTYILLPEADVQQSPAVESSDLPPPAPLDPAEHVEITSFRANRVELSASTSRPRVVVLCEMYDPDWTATVNGKPAAVRPANYLFRCVTVPTGPSTIVFEYRPRNFTAGAIVSLVALAVLIVLLARPLARRLPPNRFGGE